MSQESLEQTESRHGREPHVETSGAVVSLRNRVLNPLLMPMLGLGLTFLLLLVHLWLAEPGSGFYILQTLLAVLGMVLVFTGIILIRRELLQPLQEIRSWATMMLNNQLSSRIPVPTQGLFTDLMHDINQLSDRFQSLELDMETQVRKQTRHIKQKTRSLEILYDVAASINSSRDLDDLLTRFLHTLKEVVQARAATVRLQGKDNQMRLVASLGLSEDIVRKEQYLPSDRCLCGQAATEGSVQMHTSLRTCNRLVGSDFFDNQEIEMIAVPLQYRGRTLGVYNLFVDKSNKLDNGVDRELLVSIGRHLGMAIEKAGVDEEANRLSIIEERTRIAHELHDSLAQTLASLRFQVRVLDETLHQGDESALWAELERIENSLDEAYTELRGLIDHFSAPIDRRGLIPAVEKVIQRFRNESDIQIFLQQEWGNRELADDMEIQVLRIIQEALANVRKHSKAHVVRVLMRGDAVGNYTVLIEDDGIGMARPNKGGGPGEHVGLSIMEERARRLGGRIRIESEQGEGTRIQVMFKAPPSTQVNLQEVNIPVENISR
ncbi:MAG TPA: histidine kinase [Thiohalobacter sp.]|nr:histidine kinase [Thiohalobacter sp.]